jgi:hypothetical protein
MATFSFGHILGPVTVWDRFALPARIVVLVHFHEHRHRPIIQLHWHLTTHIEAVIVRVRAIALEAIEPVHYELLVAFMYLPDIQDGGTSSA